jgi:predicted transcriptional regulator
MDHRTQPEWLRSTKGTSFTGIGSLEAEILAVVWEQQETTVRAVYETLRQRRQIAYTTVMTVMNNLVKKNLLAQDRSGVAYVYRPAVPGSVVAQTVLESVVDHLLGGETNVAVSRLLRLDTDLTADQMDELRQRARDITSAQEQTRRAG